MKNIFKNVKMDMSLLGKVDAKKGLSLAAGVIALAGWVIGYKNEELNNKALKENQTKSIMALKDDLKKELLDELSGKKS